MLPYEKEILDWIKREGLRQIIEPFKVMRFETEWLVGYRQVEEPGDVLVGLGRNPALLNYVVLESRPGSQFFMTYLEHTYYDVLDRARNDLIGCRVVHWRDLLYTVTTIPAVDRLFAEDAAMRAGLRIVNSLPMLIEGDTFCYFPLQGKNSFHLENQAGSPFRKESISAEAARLIEEKECMQIMEVSRRRYYTSRTNG